MASGDGVQLVVGLGNPGAGHADDRHNVGFWFVDAACAARGVTLRPESRYRGQLGRDADGIRYLKPETYMNLSGESVAACANYFRIPPASILVIHDELDLPAGEIRLKSGGGHGGHNGLRSLVSHLGTADFLRVRLGVGHPGPGGDVSAYVLGRPSAEDRKALDAAIALLMETYSTLIGGDFQRAMTALNRRRKKAAKTRDETQE